MPKKHVNWIIETLNLQAHPEGGYYKETYRAQDTVIPPGRFESDSRHCSTCIYYLLETGNFSAFHRIKSDETFLYHSGDTLSIHVVQSNGTLVTYKLGDQAVYSDASFQVTIPAGLWFAAGVNEPNSYVLASCYVSPAFEFRDFELAQRSRLIEAYPQHKDLITQFTRILEPT